MTHSPLPWTKTDGCLGTWIIRDANGETVDVFLRNSMKSERPEPGVIITRDVPIPHADENCQLFFTAPRLLEALIEALPYVEGILDDPLYKAGKVKAVASRMRALIAEAEAP